MSAIVGCWIVLSSSALLPPGRLGAACSSGVRGDLTPFLTEGMDALRVLLVVFDLGEDRLRRVGPGLLDEERFEVIVVPVTHVYVKCKTDGSQDYLTC